MLSLLTPAEGRACCRPGSVPQGLRTEGTGGVWVPGWGAAASRALIPAGVIPASAQWAALVRGRCGVRGPAGRGRTPCLCAAASDVTRPAARTGWTASR